LCEVWIWMKTVHYGTIFARKADKKGGHPDIDRRLSSEKQTDVWLARPAVCPQAKQTSMGRKPEQPRFSAVDLRNVIR
jgi:hypothetical protein